MTATDDRSEGFGVLPDELLLAVFQFLPLETLLTCENVCKHWRKIARDTTLWRRFVIVYSGKPGQSEVSEKNLEIIHSHGRLISNLKLQYLYSYQEIKSILEQCSNLTSIELVMCRLGKEFESYINRWPNLKKINLKNSLLLTNDNLVINYDNFQQLKFLALSDFGISPVNCNTLLHCPCLNHIFIEKIKNLNLEFIKELIITKQRTLVTLHIYGGDSIDDHSMQLLSQCSMLKDLAIIRCENLTDKGLISLVNLQKVEHLQIWNNTNFSEFVLLHTLGSPNLKTLESLSLSRIGNISPVIVDIISEYYKNLKFLALYQCPRIINTDYEKQLKSKFRNIDVVLY